MMTQLILAFCILLLCLGGIGVKILFKKNGQFKRHCSGRDPYSGKMLGCACDAGHLCDATKHLSYQPLEVNEELLKEAGSVRESR